MMKIPKEMNINLTGLLDISYHTRSSAKKGELLFVLQKNLIITK